MNCTKCGQEIEAAATVCEHCGAEVNNGVPSVELGKPENIINGIVGAVIGALLGGLCILLLNQAGYVAAISGIVLAFCTLKGYELLGGKMSKVGIAVSAVLIIAMPFAAYLVSTGISIADGMKEYGMNLNWMEGIQLIFELLETDPEMGEALAEDLIQLYLYTGLGVVVYLASKKKKKVK
ncbi:MAG: zinc ribbon domain-containing protein [Ruminococcaceae bacterium]|nr:zinc ribbon domain-containing protein [Oscillospiraceae bacterium]